MPGKKVTGYHNGQMGEFDEDEVDYELVDHTRIFGSHINAIPIQSAVQGPRLFYGARFYNQAMPLKNREAPLVQNLDISQGPESTQSFDEILGKYSGAVFSDQEGEVIDITPDQITLKTPTGEKIHKNIYNNFPFNRKSSITNIPIVEKGQVVKKGDLLASSNYTDDKGTLALGLNVRIGVVPYKGFSMDDATVISQSLADRLQSEHTETYAQKFDRDVKSGLNHFRSLFPTRFTKEQLEHLDGHGVVKPGTQLQQGDPMILATRPRVLSSAGVNVGKLTKTLSQSRTDASQVWEHEYPGEVLDVIHGSGGVKLVTRGYAPTKLGDKVVHRSGQKSIVSKIIPDEQMPRTEDGEPLELLLNPLSIPSRTNNSLLYEIMLGKIADREGKPIKIPGFTKLGERWNDIIKKRLADVGLSDTEKIYDPAEDRFLESPALVGKAYLMKLHHVAESKSSERGQGGYDAWQSPSKGPGDGGGAKRLSGLESTVLLSSGAYKTLREGATLRGQQQDEYWRALRMGFTPKKPGVPFAWEKTMAMMFGAGINAKKGPNGVIRLAPTTDDDLLERRPVEIKKGELLNLSNMSPVPGGLFDPSLVGNNGWGAITLPFRVPNPAYEDSIRTLLGLKKKELEDILAGRKELPEHLR
jgi:DNA-directed RNA polymerase subunit beta